LAVDGLAGLFFDGRWTRRITDSWHKISSDGLYFQFTIW